MSEGLLKGLAAFAVVIGFCLVMLVWIGFLDLCFAIGDRFGDPWGWSTFVVGVALIVGGIVAIHEIVEG